MLATLIAGGPCPAQFFGFADTIRRNVRERQSF
jgi:hypothetical protein